MWRHLAAEVGTSKPGGRGVQGRTINLIGCSASGAYALGPDEEKDSNPLLRPTALSLHISAVG